MDELADCGIDRAAVTRRLRKGRLHRVHHGVFAVGYPPQTLDAHFMAAVLAGGDGANLSQWATCAAAGLVRWNGGQVDVTVPDVRWPAQRLILEIDSAWHDGRVAQELDAVRQAELEAAGERVLRTTKDQALAAPRRLFARLAAAGAPRRRTS